MAQVLGIVKCIWQGQKIKVEPDTSTFKQGGYEQDPVIVDKTINYANKMVAGEADVTTVLTRQQSLLAIWTPGQGELQLQCDTGQTYTVPDAFLQNTANFTAGKGGKVKLKWHFGIAQEILNG